MNIVVITNNGEQANLTCRQIVSIDGKPWPATPIASVEELSDRLILIEHALASLIGDIEWPTEPSSAELSPVLTKCPEP